MTCPVTSGVVRECIHERLAIEKQRIEEHRRDRQILLQALDVELAAEAPHRDLKRVWAAVRPQRDRFAVEHNLARRHRAHNRHDFGHGDRDVAQVPRVDLHLVADLVDLNARAVELVFERGLAQRGERLADAGRRIGQHRLHWLKWAEDELGKRSVAVDDRGPRDRREIAGEHRRASDPRRRDAGRARHGVHQDALERPLPQLAKKQADQKALLVGRGASEQLAKQLRPRRNGSGARRLRDPVEGRVHVTELERRRVRRRHVPHRRQQGATNAHPALTRFAAQKRDDHRDVPGLRTFEELRQVSDLLQAAGRVRHGARHRDDVGETHKPIVTNLDCEPVVCLSG